LNVEQLVVNFDQAPEYSYATERIGVVEVTAPLLDWSGLRWRRHVQPTSTVLAHFSSLVQPV